MKFILYQYALEQASIEIAMNLYPFHTPFQQEKCAKHVFFTIVNHNQRH